MNKLWQAGAQHLAAHSSSRKSRALRVAVGPASDGCGANLCGVWRRLRRGGDPLVVAYRWESADRLGSGWRGLPYWAWRSSCWGRGIFDFALARLRRLASSHRRCTGKTWPGPMHQVSQVHDARSWRDGARVRLDNGVIIVHAPVRNRRDYHSLALGALVPGFAHAGVVPLAEQHFVCGFKRDAKNGRIRALPSNCD